MKKRRKSLDGVSSAVLAELNLRYLPTLALGTLDCAWDLGEHVFGFAVDFAESLVVKQLLFVGDFYIVFFFDFSDFFFEFFVV